MEKQGEDKTKRRGRIMYKKIFSVISKLIVVKVHDDNNLTITKI